MSEPAKPDFGQVLMQCDGMLPPRVYEAIYDAAREAGGLIVEVGTAHGAGTAALALGLRDSGKEGSVITFDRVSGGPQQTYGDVEGRRALIARNLAAFGVENLVTFVPGDVEAEHRAVPEGPDISVLVLDADGKIDRDLRLFYHRLAPGAAVIIDDYKDHVWLKRTGLDRYGIDAKMKLSFHLVNHFVDSGHIKPLKVVGNTFFGRKPEGAVEGPDWSEAVRAYRELVFMDSRYDLLQFGRREAVRLLERAMPSTAQRLRLTLRSRR